MTLTLSITESQVFIGLRAWLMDVTGLDGDHVVKELSNRVPMPIGDFVNMQCVTKQNLTLPITSDGVLDTQTFTQPTDYGIQVDCYGPNSGDYSKIITTMWRTDFAFLFLKDYGIVPLWCDDAKEMHIVNSENQYEERWVSTFHLQYDPAVTLSQDFADSATVETIDTTRVYP